MVLGGPAVLTLICVPLICVLSFARDDTGFLSGPQLQDSYGPAHEYYGARLRMCLFPWAYRRGLQGTSGLLWQDHTPSAPAWQCALLLRLG